MSKRSQPFVQGDCDALCGCYCIVNAVHYLHGYIDDEQAENIFMDILHELNDSEELLIRIEEGTGKREIRKLMDYLKTDHHIYWHKPFRYKTNQTLKNIWNSMSCFLEQAQHGIILLLIRHEGEGHWTLIKKVTDKTLILFDSDNLKVILRRRCTLSHFSKNRPYTLHPTTIYYLTRKP